MRASHNVLLAHEDKTYSGAFVASASIPWGQVKGDDDLGGYHLVWTRDMVQTATALLACGGRRRRGGRWFTWRARSSRTEALRRTSGSTERPTGAASNWTRWRFRSFWRGGCGRRMRAGRAADFSVCGAGGGVPGAACADYAPGALGGECGLLAVDAGGGDCGLICAAEIARAHDSMELGEFLEEFADWIEGTWKTGR
jgi:glucoamylase